MKLSILIPNLNSRAYWLERIMYNLNWQIAQCTEPDQVEILVLKDDGEETTGAKSNKLMDMATGIAIARVDDDDMVCDQYIQKGLDFANSDKDVASLTGLYFLNGVYDRPFFHSIQYEKWWHDMNAYYRCNNHLNFVKRDLVKHIRYQDKTVGEDGNWSMDIKNAGVLKTEYEIRECLYLYYARTKPAGV